jgi:fatty-acyl-CoA synthase
MSMRWNFADLFELVADTVPERLAVAHGVHGVTRTWGEVERRTNAIANHLTANHRPGDKIAIYSYNRPEFVETLIGAMKAALVPVNVNYRYREQELSYLLDNSDATVVVYEAIFADTVAKLRDRLPRVREWIELADSGTGNAFAVDFDSVVEGPSERPDAPRSPDDLILLYTGGTTGMPKGVMWPHWALFRSLGGGGNVALGEAASRSVEEQRERIARDINNIRILPACPLMHGTGQFTAYSTLCSGGGVVTCDSRKLDPHLLWETVSKNKTQIVAIVGDAFAKPMLRAALLEHIPHLVLQDSFGASEAVGFGIEMTRRNASVKLGKFQLGPNCKVFTPEGEEVKPGSERAGFVARSGPIPIGYYKDEQKTAETFKTIQGRRWSIPGDWCTVNADGTLNLLGRGSVSINSGGEKVYPEEVEEALKLHPAVADAVVVGVPDEDWGEAVTGLVELEAGAEAGEDELRGHVRSQLAPYKAPKRFVFLDSVGRAPSGKVDYKAARERAKQALGLSRG